MAHTFLSEHFGMGLDTTNKLIPVMMSMLAPEVGIALYSKLNGYTLSRVPGQGQRWYKSD